MRIVSVILLFTVLTGCSKSSRDQDNVTADVSAQSTSTDAKIDANSPADATYVAGLMQATAFDYGSCNRTAQLRGVAAQSASDLPAVIVAVDSSGSMAARSPSGGTRMAEAARAVSSFAGRLPSNTRVGLVTFGQAGSNREADRARSCQAPVATLLAPTATSTGMSEAVGRLRPVGWTPLAAAIAAASTQSGPRGVVYIVSDGIETCGGDPVAAAQRAHAARVVINIVGFGIADQRDAAALRAVAAAGGGRYLAAAAGELDAALRTEASRAISSNSVATGQAMQDELSCYYDHMRVQAETAGKRINADQQASRISSATAAAAFKAQDARYAKASADLTAGHSSLAAKREATNAQIVNDVNPQR